MTTSLHGARAFVCAFADDDNVVRLDRLFLALGLGKNDIKYLEKEHASANSDHDALAASVQAITDPVCFGTLFFFSDTCLAPLSFSFSPVPSHRCSLSGVSNVHIVEAEDFSETLALHCRSRSISLILTTEAKVKAEVPGREHATGHCLLYERWSSIAKDLFHKWDFFLLIYKPSALASNSDRGLRSIMASQRAHTLGHNPDTFRPSR